MPPIRIPQPASPRFLSASLAALAAAALLAAEAPAQTTLKEAAAKAGLNIGAAVTGSAVTSSSRAAYQDILKREFNILVCENDMKFQPTEPTRGQFSFTAGDRVVNFAQQNGMKMRGHTLVWHAQSGWASSLNASREEMLKVMKDHIDAVAGHYKGKILEWDVVNEAVSDGSTSLRNSFWRQRIGEDFIDSAFHYAHRADPSALLFYNDYGAEGMGTKANGVYELVKRLKEKNVPIHGVGLQSHLRPNLNKTDINSNIKRLGALGLRVSITELDIVDPSHDPKPWTDLMDACVANANCVSFVTWGVYDAMSWKAENGTCDCLIYDTGLKPKPIHAALMASLAKADPAITEARRNFGATTSSIRPLAGRTPALRSAISGRGAWILLPPDRAGLERGVDARGRQLPIRNLLLPKVGKP